MLSHKYVILRYIKFYKNNIKKQRNYALMLKVTLQRGNKDQGMVFSAEWLKTCN